MMEQDLDTAALLQDWANGDVRALDALIPMIYADLRRFAHRYLRSPGETLQPTALVNEACLRLVGVPQIAFQNRAHFFATAAQMMRRILVDRHRARNAEKR